MFRISTLSQTVHRAFSLTRRGVNKSLTALRLPCQFKSVSYQVNRNVAVIPILRSGLRVISLSASNSERSHSFPKIACYISRLQRRLLSQDVTSNRSVEEEVDVHEIEEVSRAEDLIAFRDMTLGEILQQKKTIDSLVSIAETETVFEAIRTMDNNGIGAILVRDGKGDYIGIFTERDYLRKIALKGLSSRTTQVKDVMTRNLYTATNTDMATAMMHKMTQSRFRHVPVKDIETGQVIGIVSIGDIMKGVLGELADTAAFLRDFVQGKYAKLG